MYQLMFYITMEYSLQINIKSMYQFIGRLQSLEFRVLGPGICLDRALVL
jgi:hypothetical protein